MDTRIAGAASPHKNEYIEPPGGGPPPPAGPSASAAPSDVVGLPAMPTEIKQRIGGSLPPRDLSALSQANTALHDELKPLLDGGRLLRELLRPDATAHAHVATQRLSMLESLPLGLQAEALHQAGIGSGRTRIHGMFATGASSSGFQRAIDAVERLLPEHRVWPLLHLAIEAGRFPPEARDAAQDKVIDAVARLPDRPRCLGLSATPLLIERRLSPESRATMIDRLDNLIAQLPADGQVILMDMFARQVDCASAGNRLATFDLVLGAAGRLAPELRREPLRLLAQGIEHLPPLQRANAFERIAQAESLMRYQGVEAQPGVAPTLVCLANSAASLPRGERKKAFDTVLNLLPQAPPLERLLALEDLAKTIRALPSSDGHVQLQAALAVLHEAEALDAPGRAAVRSELRREAADHPESWHPDVWKQVLSMTRELPAPAP
jgi:hypothetical protein